MKKAFILILLLCFPEITLASDWPIFQGNQYLTGNNDETIPLIANTNWSFSASANLYYPVPIDDCVLISSLNHNLYCLNMKTGLPKWTYQSSSPLIRSAVVKGSNIIIPAGAIIQNINLFTGKLRWAMNESPNNIYIFPIINNNRVIYATRKTLFCRDLSSGRMVWKSSNVNIYGGSATTFDDILVVQSRKYSKKMFTVSAFRAGTGTLLWEKEINESPVPFTPVIFNKNVFIGSGSMLYSMDIYTGHLNWMKQLDFNIVSECVFANGKLFLASDSGSIFEIDPATGDSLHSIPFSSERLYFSIVGENMFVLEYTSGNVYRVDLNSYIKMIFYTPPTTTPGGHQMAIAKGVLFIPRDNILYAVGNILPDLPQLLASPPKTISGQITDELGNPIKGDIFLGPDGKKIPSTNGKFEIPVLPNGKQTRIEIISENRMYKSFNITNYQSDIKIPMDLIAKNKTFSLDNIYFDFNRSDLKSEAIPVVLSVKEYLVKNPNVKLEIIGHTDNVGEETYNQILSVKRAERVCQYLVKNGINENRLTFSGKGSSLPAFDNSVESGRAKNRRIEFIIR